MMITVVCANCAASLEPTTIVTCDFCSETTTGPVTLLLDGSRRVDFCGNPHAADWFTAR